MSQYARQPRVLAALSAGLAIIGLVLAGLAVYCVAAHDAVSRRHEMGIRLALGADPGDVQMRILRRGVLLVACGAMMGALITSAIATSVDSLLFGVHAREPLSTALATLAMIGAAALATIGPARRVARLDPGLLRSE